MKLTVEEQLRYNRQLILPEIGIEGQQRLKNSKVLVIGAGGLGSPVLLYLAAAGVGTIGVIDDDYINSSNLHRQVIYKDNQVGNRKAIAAKKNILDLNPDIDVIVYTQKLTRDNALDIIANYDVISDGSDNFQTRYLVNDACVISEKPLVYASISQFEGQVTVFNQYLDGLRTPNYRDLYPTPPNPGEIPSCAEGGVLGVLPGIIGSMQANEVIKLIVGFGTTLAGRLFCFDAKDFTSKTFKYTKNSEVQDPIELMDYDFFCGLSSVVQEISVQEFIELRKSNQDFTLIDVRTKEEYQLYNIGGMNLPLHELEQHLHEIPTIGMIILHCKSGNRSRKAIEILTKTNNYSNLINLTGGIEAYAQATRHDN